MPPWNSCSSSHTSTTSSDLLLLNNQSKQSNKQYQLPDISFENDTHSSAFSSPPSRSITAPNPPSWADSCQVESLEQLTSFYEFDHLFVDPSAGFESLSSHSSSTSPGQSDLLLDFSRDFDQATFNLGPQPWLSEHIDLDRLGTIGVEGHGAAMLQTPQTAPGGLPSHHSASPLDLVSLEMDRLTSTSTIFDNTSSASMTKSHSQTRDRPMLAPRPTPPSSSFSASPPLTFVDAKPAGAAGTKRSRAESAAADSSNNSAQDSEEERAVEKRRRNTMAARRFRKRKQDHVSDLESKLAKVTEERDELRLQIAKWEGEVMALRKLMERKD